MLLAESFHSNITLLHVITGDNRSNDTERILEQFAREKLREKESMIRSANIEVADAIIEKGIPFERIIQIAQTMDYNVIVVGAGNKAGNDVFRLGTTVEKLMRKNQIPLWVVKNESNRHVRRILCPVDFSDASTRALANAITLAKSFESELRILNVFTPVNIVSPRFNIDNEKENKRLRKAQQREFRSFLKEFHMGSVKHEIEILDGEPHKVILNYLQQDQYDLLMMGTSGKTGLSRILMGSVTEKVTREVPCSFITMKAKDITDDIFESNINDIEGILKVANEEYKQADFETAARLYLTGLRQYPDNIPLIKGVIRSYASLGNENKAEYYRKYATEIIRRTWGEAYLDKMDI
jgi:nucleotide-binding universal stress UspA family protein